MKLSYALIGILIFIGIHIEGMTDTNINQVPIMREYWLLLGTLLVGGRILRENETESSSREE